MFGNHIATGLWGFFVLFFFYTDISKAATSAHTAVVSIRRPQPVPSESRCDESDRFHR